MKGETTGNYPQITQITQIFYYDDGELSIPMVIGINSLQGLRRLTNREAQLINYLKVTGYPVGLLINLGAKSLETRRLALKKSV